MHPRARLGGLVFSRPTWTGAMVAGGLAALACGSGSSEASSADPPAPPATFGATDAAAPVEECADATKDVFVVSSARTLYRFNPPTLTFESVGVVTCGDPQSSVTSMAVDRRGTAWVRMSDGGLWKVDTKTAACTRTSYVVPAENSAFHQFGMGFSSVRAASAEEQLFLSDNQKGAGVGLAELDTKTARVKYIGPYSGSLAGRVAELTGTGDGRLYGFFVTAPARIAQIDKSTGNIVTSYELLGIAAATSWAFSFYGGDFYVYTANTSASDAGAGSDVRRFRPSDGTLTLVKAAVGFDIVGAGVSTCAPLEAPR